MNLDSKYNPNHEMMFDLTPHFQEIFNDPDYFYEKKEGLKAIVIYISPYDYMAAVKKEKKNHHESDYKLDSLREAYEAGIKVPMPYLAYGERDEAIECFRQEGFNRAYTSSQIDKSLIPVSIRYRDNDPMIPSYIKEAILKAEVEQREEIVTKEAAGLNDDGSTISPLASLKI